VVWLVRGYLPFDKRNLPEGFGYPPFLKRHLPFPFGHLPFSFGNYSFLSEHYPEALGHHPFKKRNLPFSFGHLPSDKRKLFFYFSPKDCVRDVVHAKTGAKIMQRKKIRMAVVKRKFPWQWSAWTVGHGN